MSAVPDVAGEILAYRAWRVVTTILDPPGLYSLYSGFRWAPRGWSVAHCGTGSLPLEGVPHSRHECGIYAARDRQELVNLGYWDLAKDLGATVALGEVALAGDVIRGERGWRGEKARPVRLWLAHEDWPLVRPLEQEYGVPVGLTNLLRR